MTPKLRDLRDAAIEARIAYQEHQRKLMLRKDFATLDVAGRLDAIVREFLLELEAPAAVPLHRRAV